VHISVSLTYHYYEQGVQFTTYESNINNRQDCKKMLKLNIVSDFLNPLSREEVVEESGLLQDISDIEMSSPTTDHNPDTLGLSLEEADAMLPDDLFTEDTDFQFC